MIDLMPITKSEMIELLSGIHTKLDSHEDLLETLATEMTVVQDILHQHDKRFDHHDELLEDLATEMHVTQEAIRTHDKRFDHQDKRFDQIDDLLETVASEVNTISTMIEPIVPIQHNHEERITSLERGYRRLILKT